MVMPSTEKANTNEWRSKFCEKKMSLRGFSFVCLKRMGNGSREKRLGVPGSSDGGWRLAKMEFAETLGRCDIRREGDGREGS